MEVAQEVEVVTSDASILQPVDVILTSNVLENIVGVRDLGQEVGYYDSLQWGVCHGPFPTGNLLTFYYHTLDMIETD